MMLIIPPAKSLLETRSVTTYTLCNLLSKFNSLLKIIERITQTPRESFEAPTNRLKRKKNSIFIEKTLQTVRISSLKSTNEYYPSNNCEILEKNLFDFFAFLREEGLKTGVFNKTTRSNIDASYDGGKLVETGTALPPRKRFRAETRELASRGWYAGT